MSEVEDEFWSWVAQEKAKLERVIEQVEEVPDLITWLEREIREAEEEAFSAKLRREDPTWWEGYASALRDVLNAIRRREVRA
ncbi:hypothetical protein [Thermococcus sp.]|uniref:hypothetical protein n=1 Tax=Thermococcus sp. TaxID=35749 RepID=UPI0026297BF3|nr:hypothetical protein [Thermococcus sp.]